jgi:crossover junction endodeoxyribonuclease RusA
MIELIVYGSPAPQGSKKFAGTTKEGRGILVESSAKVRPWRMDVKQAAEQLRVSLNGLATLDGPLSVSMVFTLPKPASAPKRRRTWPDRKPDVSKLARSTEDAISDAGLWADDARVVEYTRLAKVFPGEDHDALAAPGVRVRITRLDVELPCATLLKSE